MRTITQFRAYKALPIKKAPGKTPTGTEFGRLLDCKVTESFALVSLVYSIPKTFPRWSCLPRAWEQSSWGRGWYWMPAKGFLSYE